MRIRGGSILIFAIWVLAFFSILSVSLYKIATSQINVTSHLRQRLVSEYLAKAACVYARAQRNNDVTSYDTLYELRDTQQKTLGWGEFIFEMVDEESKININTASKEILSQLPGFNEELAEAVVTSEFRPFNVREEVLLVEGMEDGIFNQCKDLITVYGKGAVNINTAGKEVLQTLGIDEDLAYIIPEYRAGPDGKEATEDDRVFEEKGTILEQLRSYTGLFVE